MNESKTKTTYDQAEEYFHTAQEDFLKPEEDVVPHSVCVNAMKAVQQYLIAYLNDRGKKADASMTTESLLDACKKIDPNFYQINLAGKLHLNRVEDVYMDMKTTRSYLTLATSVRELVL